MKLFTLQKATPIVDGEGKPTHEFLAYERQGLQSQVVPLAKLTSGGADGSITVFNGKVVNFVAPT